MSIYLVDYENVNLGGLNGVETLKEGDRVFIFYGQNPGYIPFEKHILICKAKASIEYLRVDRQAKNYLDFQLATYSGYLIAKYDDRDYVIVSKDTGFDSIVNFWNRDPEGLGVHFTRRESILVPQAPKKQSREKEQKADAAEQNGVARPSSSLLRRTAETLAAEAPAIEEAPVLPAAEPEPEEKADAAEPETKSRSRRSRRRRGKKRDTPVESEGLLPEVTAEAEAEAAVTDEIPAEAIPEEEEEKEEEEKFDPDSLSLGVSPEDQLTDRAKRILEADDMMEVLRKEDEKAEEPAPEEAPIADEPKAEEKPAEEKKESKPETTMQSGTRKPRIRYGKGRKEQRTEEVKEAPAEETPAEVPVETAPAEVPAAEEPAPVEEPITETPEEEEPAVPEKEEIPAETAPAAEEKAEEAKPEEAKPEKVPAKPVKLPERIKSKIREAVKDEKLSSGAYTQLYNRILKSADGDTLKAELVRSFSSEKGAKLYELILPAFTEYLTTKK